MGERGRSDTSASIGNKMSLRCARSSDSFVVSDSRFESALASFSLFRFVLRMSSIFQFVQLRCLCSRSTVGRECDTKDSSFHVLPSAENPINAINKAVRFNVTLRSSSLSLSLTIHRILCFHQTSRANQIRAISNFSSQIFNFNILQFHFASADDFLGHFGIKAFNSFSNFVANAAVRGH